MAWGFNVYRTRHVFPQGILLVADIRSQPSLAKIAKDGDKVNHGDPRLDAIGESPRVLVTQGHCMKSQVRAIIIEQCSCAGRGANFIPA